MPAGQPLIFSNDSRNIVVLTGKRAAVYDAVSGKSVTVEKKPVSTTKKVLKVL